MRQLMRLTQLSGNAVSTARLDAGERFFVPMREVKNHVPQAGNSLDNGWNH